MSCPENIEERHLSVSCECCSSRVQCKSFDVRNVWNSKVPLLPGDGGGRQPPFLFSKGPESIAVSEAQQRLCCPVAGAVFVKKLAMKAQTQSADAAPKKRPRVPDFSDSAPKKAPRAKGKAKAKAKAAASGKNAGDVLEQETQESLQADVEFALGDEAGDGRQELPAGSRQRLWLDDVLAALQRCQTGPFAAVASTKAAGQLVSMLLSFALEFSFTGSVRLQKAKPLKVWSQVPRFSRSVRAHMDLLFE